MKKLSIHTFLVLIFLISIAEARNSLLTYISDDNGKSIEVDLKAFIDHLNEFHKTGTSTHTQSGCSFTVNDAFRKKIRKLYEK